VVERLARRSHGLVDVVRRSVGDLPDDLLGMWRHDVDHVAALGLHVLAADEQRVVDLHGGISRVRRDRGRSAPYRLPERTVDGAVAGRGGLHRASIGVACHDALVTVANRHEDSTTLAGRTRHTARAVVRDALVLTAAELRVWCSELAVDVTGDAVHQARVTIRRAQSTLDLGPTIFVPGSVGGLRGELRWMMDALGAIRDLDVMIPRLADLGADPMVTDALEQDRDEAATRLQVMVGSPRCDDLLRSLDEFARNPATAPQADDAARRRLAPIVRKRWRKLATAVDELGPAPRAGELHRVRILAKRCRYTCELLEREFGKPAARMARRLRSVQDELGALNDTRVLVTRLRELGARSPQLAFACGRAAGIAEATDRSDRDRWRTAWDRLDRKPVRRWL
jgi:CHAD domain-containing protein